MGAVQLTDQDQVAYLMLSNPKRGNALDFEMLADLKTHFETLQKASQIKALLVYGDPSARHFCTGADINCWSNLSIEKIGSHWINPGNQLFDTLAELPMPTFSMIHGLCLGGGFELALATNLILADESSFFSFPEVSIGAIAGWRGGQRLSQRIGMSRSRQLIFSAERLSAKRAENWGLVNTLLSGDDLFDQAIAYIQPIIQQPNYALRAAKSLLADIPLSSQQHADALAFCMRAKLDNAS